MSLFVGHVDDASASLRLGREHHPGCRVRFLALFGGGAIVSGAGDHLRGAPWDPGNDDPAEL